MSVVITPRGVGPAMTARVHALLVSRELTNQQCADIIDCPKETVSRVRAANGIPRVFTDEGQEKRAWTMGVNAVMRGSTRVAGYRMTFLPMHPAANARNEVCEHRLIAERSLGRFLAADERIHHINELKLDNRPSNLAVLSHPEHQLLHSWLRKGRLFTVTAVDGTVYRFGDLHNFGTPGEAAVSAAQAASPGAQDSRLGPDGSGAPDSLEQAAA